MPKTFKSDLAWAGSSAGKYTVPQDECEFERTSTFRVTQHSIGNAFPIAACLISELWIFKKPNGRLLIFLRSGWETAGIDDPQWFSRIHCRWWTYSKEKKMNSQIFDWFCGALPYLWPNKAPLNCYLFTKEENMTSQIPLKPHHLFPPKNSKPRIPQQATMDFCKSFPSVHQSSGCCSLPRPIGAVSIFGGTSQIKSTDLTDFLGFWSQQMAKHGGMIFLLLCLFTPAHAEHI